METYMYLDLLQARHSHKRIRVIRIETTTDNQRIVGLSIPNAAVETVLQGIASLSHDLETSYDKSDKETEWLSRQSLICVCLFVSADLAWVQEIDD